jgi:hypothetical protein
LTATSFRLHGCDALADAAGVVAREAALYGAVADPDFTGSEREQLAALADARRDPALARLAAAT